MSKILLGWLRIVFGLIIFAFGVHLTIKADLGLAPWDCFGMGISYHTPLNYGLSMTVMGVVLLIIDLCLKEKIGFGTVIDAMLTGNFVQFFNDMDKLPHTPNTFVGIVLIIAGLALMALGQYFYMTSAQCCGPKDALLIGIGKRFKKMPIGVVQYILWGTVFLIGWLLGGPVGIGTVVTTLASGVVTQAVYAVLKFEPRNITHQSVGDILKLMSFRDSLT